MRMISGVAKTQLNLRRFPFDKQSLKAVFEVLGFDKREVVLKVDPAAEGFRVRHRGADLRVVVRSPRRAELARLMPIRRGSF